MKTLEAEIKLMEFFDIRRKLIVPNITDFSGLVRFETDLLVLSKSNYATAVEIKVSKADLKNDLKKRHISNSRLFNHYYKPLKHFYYAVPKILVNETKAQVPDYAGIIEIGRKCRIIRKPKLLFNTKWTNKQRYQLARLGAMRILKFKKKLLKLS